MLSKGEDHPPKPVSSLEKVRAEVAGVAFSEREAGAFQLDGERERNQNEACREPHGDADADARNHFLPAKADVPHERARPSGKRQKQQRGGCPWRVDGALSACAYAPLHGGARAHVIDGFQNVEEHRTVAT